MVDTLKEDLIQKLETDQSGNISISQLVELGREQGYITYDNILEIFPEAEQELDRLEKVFATLISQGIPYVEDTGDVEEQESELDEELDEDEVEIDQYQSLANIDTNDLVEVYLKEAANHDLLTIEEEVSLAKTIEKGKVAREKLAVGDITAKERRNLKQIIDEEQAAVDKLIKSNTRLVISVAKKYKGRGVPFIDLIQEGNIGLMRAAKKFDYKRGFKFSTYATWWIRQAVTRAIADNGRTIRIPVHMGDQISKMYKTQNKLKQRLGREPSEEELAEAIEVSPDRLSFLQKISRHPISLELPISSEGDSVIGDFIEDNETPDPDETATHNLLQQHIENALAELPARAAMVLRLRFGLAGGTRHTLQEAGNKMGVSRERVRQIERRALQRLRSPMIRRKLMDFLGQNRR